MPEKRLILKEVVDRYPRMLGLLKAVESRAYLHDIPFHVPDSDMAGVSSCLKCQIQALLAEVEK